MADAQTQAEGELVKAIESILAPVGCVPASPNVPTRLSDSRAVVQAVQEHEQAIVQVPSGLASSSVFHPLTTRSLATQTKLVALRQRVAALSVLLAGVQERMDRMQAMAGKANPSLLAAGPSTS
eukprot:scaffold2572_cov391-Prasinococcus_capsulatus_cf.AAC.2